MSRPILTVTLNAAIDEAIVLDELVPGRSNRARLDALDPGGKGINASRVMTRLGCPTIALGFVGGVTGEMIRARLDAEGVAHAFDDVEQLTRLNVMVYERTGGRRTRLYLEGAFVAPQRLGDLRERLAAAQSGDIVVLGGSLPPGLTDTTYRDLVQWLRERGVCTFVDTSGAALAAVLPARPYLIKPNVEEASDVLGRPIENDRDALQAAAELHERGATYVVVSQGAEGAVAVGPDGRWKVYAPVVEARSTVGSGDSMVAGLAVAMHRGDSMERGLCLGTAAGAATAMTSGTQLCDPQAVTSLLGSVRIERATAIGI